ncbi:MAG: peptidoglycan DD-metalloendopeptidase family protein [Candidatus Aminicenantes bacterium]|nr:peptidoglycan DD-metalloendopeptidase family protein [Candidatus Aminicenantes bacterium]
MKLAAAALALSLGLGLASAPAVSPDQSQSGATAYEQSLDKVRRDIDSLRKKLKEDEAKEQTTLNRLDRIGITGSLLRNEGRMLTLQLDKNRADLEAARRRIPELEARLGSEREALTRVLVTLYKYGRFRFARFLLQARDLKSLAVENKRLTILAAAQNSMIEDYGRNLTELGRAAAALAAKEKETALLLGRASAKKAELDREEGKARTLVAQIRADKQSYEKALGELARRAQELQVMIQRLQSQDYAPPFTPIPMAERKGRLTWPTRGKVLQAFGVQVHPQFNTVTMNNGVEIAPPDGDLAVRAVHDGRVAFAELFPAYGNLLIINHGDGYHSLYGHLSEFLVKSGDYVIAGQPVAIAGDTGSLVGVSVYFEIRHLTKPVDPLQWLSRR